MNMDMTKSPLPSSVVIDAVPQRNRYGSVVYWPRVRPASERNIGLRDAAAVRDTGKKVVWIGEVDLKRRVAERDVSLSLGFELCRCSYSLILGRDSFRVKRGEGLIST